VIETNDFAIDLADKRIRRNGEEIHLTPTEWQISSARDIAASRSGQQLLQQVGSRVRARRIPAHDMSQIRRNRA
jgi:two-component system KDP operon response regulator KdpE